MITQEGPRLSLPSQAPKLLCTGCCWAKQTLIKSGRQPIWEAWCLHPNIKEGGISGNLTEMRGMKLYNWPVCVSEVCPVVQLRKDPGASH